MKFANALLFVTLIGLTSCKKECEAPLPACNDTVPTDELCQAYFERWFYDKASNSCQLKAYGGCNAWGFATKEACEECLCH